MKQFTIYHTNDIHSCFDEFAKIQTYLRTHASVNDWVLDAGDFADAKHIAVSGTNGSGATALLDLARYDALAIGNNEAFQGIEGIQGLTANKIPLLSCNLVYEDGSTIEEIRSHMISEKNGIRLLLIGVSPFGSYSVFLNLFGLESLNPENRIRQIMEMERGRYDFCVLLSHCGLNQDRVFAEKTEGIDLIVGGHSHTLMADVEKIHHTYIHQSGNYGQHIGKITVCAENEKIVSVQAENMENTFETDKELELELHRQTQIGTEYLNKTLYTLPEELPYNPVEECRSMNALCDMLLKQYPCDFALMHHGILEEGISGAVSKTKLLRIAPSPLNPTKMEIKGSAVITAIRQSFDQAFCMQDGHGSGFRGTCLGALAVSANVRITKNPFSMKINGREIEPDRTYCMITDDYLQRGTGYRSLEVENGIYYRDFIRDTLEKGLSDQEVLETSKIRRIYSNEISDERFL